MFHRCKGYYSILNKTHVCVLLNGFHSILTTPKRLPTYAGFHDLNTLLRPNTFQWNAIIKAYVDAGLFDAALSLFPAMQDCSVQPDHYTFPLIFRAISALATHTNLGKVIHCLGIQMGLASDVYFCNTAIDMYVRCNSLSSARLLFDEMCNRDVVSWTAMISGYVQIGDCRQSFRLFREMQSTGLEPSSVTLAVMLRACDVDKDAHGGRQLHGFAIKRGFENHELVQNSILTVFSKVGCFQEAIEFFSRIESTSVVSWNIIMAGYLSIGDVSKVVDCFERLMAENKPSYETLTLVLSAFAKSKDLQQGQKVHGYALKRGQVDSVLQSSLVDFYAKCGELAMSIQFFEEIEPKSCIHWSTMMRGLIEDGRFREVIGLFQRMQAAGFEPVNDTLRILILAYTHLGALKLGKGIHGCLIKNKFGDDLDKAALETSILNMYAKCGSIVVARKCFEQMVVKDTIAWSSMVEGYAIHGLGLEAFKLFYQMQEEQIKPNAITFLSLLSACSHSGLVSEGCELFNCMTKRYGIKPELNHYTCMVDLLGRSGKLHEALQVIQHMITEPDGRIWGSLLASCRVYSEGKLGAFAAQRLLDLEPDNIGYHIVLSNIHASDSKWDEAENIRKFMGEKEFKKNPGWSCIEVKGGIHMFIVGDRWHPQVQEIYEVLGCLTKLYMFL